MQSPVVYFAEAENVENEKEYFTRVHLALTECGTNVLCKLLLKIVKELTPKDHPSPPWSLDEFLHYKNIEILSAIGKDKRKADIIFPYKRDTDLQKWDISLFVHILLTACDLEANEQIHGQLKHDMCNLRDLRNKISHKQTHKLTKAMYQSYYGRIQGSVLRICEYMQEPDLQKSFQKELDKFECLGHVYANGLITENHKHVEVINEGDGTVENSLQLIKSIIQQKGLTVNIPAVDVMLMFYNYNKDDEQVVSESLHALFSEALDKENIFETDETLHCVDFRADLKNEVLSLVRKLFQEKRTIARVSTGCLILTIQCPDLDSVISLIQDSISGRLTDLFSSLEEVMRTDPSNESFDVYAGITKQSCWSLLNTLFCNVSKECSHSNFNIESLIQNEGVSMRILNFLGSVHEKEQTTERILSNENNEIRMQLTEKLKQYLSQPQLEMQCLLHERKGEGFIDKDVETSFSTQHDDDVQQALIERFEIDRIVETNTVPEDRWQWLRSPSGSDKHMAVAAIDLGSTYSGYAFQFRGCDKICTVSSFHGCTVTYKTPTTILFDKDKNFNSFGYQAENKYAELAEEDNHFGWRHFRCFKMELYRMKDQKKLRVTSKLKDDQGQTMDIIDVFGSAIKYLKDELLGTLLTNAPRFEENDIKWLITVPAIWEDAAKQIMVLAAGKAGIARAHLQLVYEPEAAAIFCKNEYSMSVDPRQKDIFKPGSNFILVDLGGGIVDITAHKVNDDGTLDALVPPSGGPWGGHNVNKKFFELLEDLFGAEVLRKFSAEEMDERLELERSFEVKKRYYGQFSIKLPARLIELAGVSKMKEIQHSQKVAFRKDKLLVNATAVLGIFKETIKHTIVHVNEILQKADLQNVSTIVLVGGFAESKILQQEVKSRFDPKKYMLVIPQAPELAVLKGAVLYGLDESLIRSHRMPYTVGIDAAVEFDEGQHPAKLRHFQNGSFKCTGIFKVFIERGTQIQPNTASAEHKFRAPNPKEAVIELYKSDRDDIPTYTEDCRRLGEVKLILIAPTQADQIKKDDSTKENPMINVQMYFGDTLVNVKAEEVGTNNSIVAEINFLL